METEKEQEQGTTILMLDENTRVIAFVSGQYEITSVFAINQGIALETIQSAKGMAHYTGHSIHSNAIQEIIGEAIYLGDFDKVKGLISDYLNGEKVPYLFYELKGYSQGEWNDVVVYPISNPENYTLDELKNAMTEIDAYYKGEVYLVQRQFAKVYTADDGSVYREWLNDDDYAYVEVVQEFFEITPEFVAENYLN